MLWPTRHTTNASTPRAVDVDVLVVGNLSRRSALHSAVGGAGLLPHRLLLFCFPHIFCGSFLELDGAAEASPTSRGEVLRLHAAWSNDNGVQLEQKEGEPGRQALG